MEKYVYRAKASAAHFQFTNGPPDFGDEYTLTYYSESPGEVQRNTGARTGPEIKFSDSSVSISCTKEPGVYTTEVWSVLKNFNVNDVLTADAIESGLMTIYREEWYSDPSKPKRARAVPLPLVITNLQIFGVPFRLGHELQLPDPFNYDPDQRTNYLNGKGPEIEPIGISQIPGGRIPSPHGDIKMSDDTRRIDVPDFGIVYIADWSWQPQDANTPAKSAHWVEAVRLDLHNPGTGGGGGTGGNGTSY